MFVQPNIVKLPNPDDDALVPDTNNLVADARSNYVWFSCLYLMLIVSIWLVEILVHCNTPAYIFTISNCNRNSPYLATLPLFSNYVGNSSDSDFYFSDWNFTPNKGFCPTVPMPQLNSVPHFEGPNRRRLSLTGMVEEEKEEGWSPLLGVKEKEAEREKTESILSQQDGGPMDVRDLRASGGGGGGHGGGSSGGSSSSSSSSGSSSSSSSSGSSSSGRSSSSSGSYYNGGTRVYYYGGGYNQRLGGSAAVQYFGCVTFGLTSGSRAKDQNSLNIWANIDAANADANYNAGLKYGSLTSTFVQGANGMVKVRLST